MIHKIYKNVRNSKNWKGSTKQEVLSIVAACKCDPEEIDNQKLVSALNRGGLWAVSREIQEVFREAELEFRNATLSMVTTKINIDLIVNELLSNSKLIDIFNTIIEGCELQTRDKTRQCLSYT